MTLLLFAIQPSWGQQLRNLNILMIEDSISTVRLTKVTMLPSHTYFDENGRSDIFFTYEVEGEIKGEYFFSGRTNVRFLPTDTNEIYKVEEMVISEGRQLGMNDVQSDVSLPPEWSFKGYSNDTTLFPVRVYHYYRQNAPVYKVYEADELDERPYFNFNDSKLYIKEYKEYIYEQMKKEWKFTENMCGTVTFSFEIHSYGWVFDFQVENLDLKPKNEPFRFSGGMEINFAKQIDMFFCSLSYKIVEYGFYKNDPKRYWTPGKINGEAVTSKQYITFNLE